ncbi:MAG: NUDIX hydrolase [Candidatus Moranbacteria bacterium]|nr:NUDIX hydrolase [Candidatus Moranbacteria bacterium]MBP6034201.1 NUDIX hydrolase [Candidatus Moranbacteria bacterium]
MKRNLELIEKISPIDELEKTHQEDALHWIKSGVEIFRIEKPDKPPKHLVSYFVVIDIENKAILLVDHIKAELWLPAGGHVEADEDPKATVEREAMEELNLTAKFIRGNPFFLTITTTVGKTAGHKDVSLWYLLSGGIQDEIRYDPGEFNGYKWFTFDEILQAPTSSFDPHMHRFIQKLKADFEI